MRRHFKAFFFLLLLGFLAFSNGLSNPFLIDDHAFFEEKLRNIKYLPLHFLPDKNRALQIEGQSADPFYRPLATVVPMLSYLAFKGNFSGHHLTNLVLFCVAGWGIYLFLLRLGASTTLAFLAGALYIVHPINGVSVNYITASIFPVQVILMLGSLYFLVSFPRKRESMVFSCILYLFSTWCHETAMALPFYAFILCAVFGPTHPPGVCRSNFREVVRSAWRQTWPLFAVLGALIVFRMFFSSLGVSIINKISLYNMSFPEYLATWTMLLSWYLSRLFWPQNIVLIMAHQPLKEGLGIWLVLLVLLIVLAVYLVWTFRHNKIMLLGLLWFIAGFAPFTLACFFQPIHGLMIEPHWFLFPVIGFFIFVAGAFTSVLDSRSAKRPPKGVSGNDKGLFLARAALGVVIFTSVFFSRWHNWVWADEVRYCTFWLQQSPAFVAVNGYLAKAYELRKQFEPARQHYYYMLDRGYKDYISYTNLALMDMQEGKWESAKANLLKVMEIDPHASVAVSDLGTVYFKEENYTKALEYFERAKTLNRFTILPYLNIAQAHLKLGDQNKAAQALQEVLNIVPGEEHAMVDLIQIYLARKDKENVLKIARLMSAHSRNPYTLRNAAVLLKNYGFENEADKALQKAQGIFSQGK